MDNYKATGIAEGFIEAKNENEVIKAWQHLIDTGLCWTLQGFFGRTATNLINNGVCQKAKQFLTNQYFCGIIYLTEKGEKYVYKG